MGVWGGREGEVKWESQKEGGKRLEGFGSGEEVEEEEAERGRRKSSSPYCNVQPGYKTRSGGEEGEEGRLSGREMAWG